MHTGIDLTDKPVHPQMGTQVWSGQHKLRSPV